MEAKEYSFISQITQMCLFMLDVLYVSVGGWLQIELIRTHELRDRESIVWNQSSTWLELILFESEQIGLQDLNAIMICTK